MTLIERYLKGETTEVYSELYALGQDALNPLNFVQTNLVLTETFKRVKINLDIIYNELRKIKYQFVSNIQYDWQKPLQPPSPNVDELLSELSIKIKNAGYIPLSLAYFYKIVGSCNFCWDWKSNPDIPWEGADPLDIPPLTILLTELVYDDYDRSDVLLSGDYLQKDNISGDCYCIELTPTESVDSLMIEFDFLFIEYLRKTINNCGFTMADQCEYESLRSFCNAVEPMLLKI